jgi:hypothetical protein
MKMVVLCALSLISCLALGQTGEQSSQLPLPSEPVALVNSLYVEVISRHPMGIPEGDVRKIFDIYLSKQLLLRIDEYRACTTDWFHKNNTPNLKPAVGLFENSIFSGGNEQATPTSFKIISSSAVSDGSVEVLVQLSSNAYPGKPWEWPVKVVLVKDGDIYRVNDVIYVNSQWGGKNTRLTEYLSRGCDRPRGK